MQQRRLGPSGLQVSLVGLGCNNFGGRIDLEATRKVIHKALDLGITLFDTADSYGNRGGSETLMGQVLGDRRKDIVLATKFGLPMDDAGRLRGGSRRYIMSAVEASLRRLKTDWIDLYQMHRLDPHTPIEETLRALDDLIRQGKLRYVGCSNFPAWRVVESLWTAKHHNLNGFISCQDHYNLLERGIDGDLVPAIDTYGLGLLPFFPLAGGLLTGKYAHAREQGYPAGTRLGNDKAVATRFASDRNWKVIDQLQTFVDARGRTMLELAFSWLAARPGVSSVIAGATRPEQLEQNVRAAEWMLSAAEMSELDRITLESN